MTTLTTTPGSDSGSTPIKTYPEQLEKDISNIIARCSVKTNGEYIIGDLSMLTVELMEYMIDTYGEKVSN